jgi:hypothetical protein
MLAFAGMLLVYGLVICLVGVGLFIFGFYFYKKKRLIEDIPTSKIRSLTMGLVEVYGQVVSIPEHLLTSPFTEKDCVYYRYTVEEYRSTGKSAHWVTIKKGEERRVFYLQDETGMVLIDPTDASIEAARDFECKSGLGDDPPDMVMRFLAANNIAYEGLLGMNKTMRFRESILVPTESVYIMGCADENTYEDAVLNQGISHTMIRKGRQEKMFFISDKKERDILREFTWKTVGGVVGGFLCIVIGVFLMVL